MEASGQYTTDNDVLRLASAIKGLFLARHISLDAYFLGMQVCQRFMEYKTFRVVLTHREATTSYVLSNDVLLAGRVSPDTPDFIEAMQGLHFIGHVLSHYVETELDKSDAHERHFTLNPQLSMGVDVKMDTPILFKFDISELASLEQHSLECLEDDLLAKFTARRIAY